MPESLTPEQRALRARVASYTSWARTSSPTERTAPARAAALERFAAQIDPEGVLPVAERTRRAEAQKKAYFCKLALMSAKARSSKRSGAA